MNQKLTEGVTVKADHISFFKVDDRFARQNRGRELETSALGIPRPYFSSEPPKPLSNLAILGAAHKTHSPQRIVGKQDEKSFMDVFEDIKKRTQHILNLQRNGLDQGAHTMGVNNQLPESTHSKLEDSVPPDERRKLKVREETDQENGVRVFPQPQPLGASNNKFHLNIHQTFHQPLLQNQQLPPNKLVAFPQPNLFNQNIGPKLPIYDLQNIKPSTSQGSPTLLKNQNPVVKKENAIITYQQPLADVRTALTDANVNHTSFGAHLAAINKIHNVQANRQIPQQKYLLNDSCSTPRSISTMGLQEGLSPYPREMMSSLRRHQELYQFSPTTFLNPRTPKKETKTGIVECCFQMKAGGINLKTEERKLTEEPSKEEEMESFTACFQAMKNNGQLIPNLSPTKEKAGPPSPILCTNKCESEKKDVDGHEESNPQPSNLLTASITNRVEAIIEATQTIKALEQKLKDLSELYPPVRKNMLSSTPEHDYNFQGNPALEESRNTVFITEGQPQIQVHQELNSLVRQEINSLKPAISTPTNEKLTQLEESAQNEPGSLRKISNAEDKSPIFLKKPFYNKLGENFVINEKTNEESMSQFDLKEKTENMSDPQETSRSFNKSINNDSAMGHKQSTENSKNLKNKSADATEGNHSKELDIDKGFPSKFAEKKEDNNCSTSYKASFEELAKIEKSFPDSVEIGSKNDEVRTSTQKNNNNQSQATSTEFNEYRKTKIYPSVSPKSNRKNMVRSLEIQQSTGKPLTSKLDQVSETNILASPREMTLPHDGDNIFQCPPHEAVNVSQYAESLTQMINNKYGHLGHAMLQTPKEKGQKSSREVFLENSNYLAKKVQLLTPGNSFQYPKNAICFENESASKLQAENRGSFVLVERKAISSLENMVKEILEKQQTQEKLIHELAKANFNLSNHPQSSKVNKESLLSNVSAIDKNSGNNTFMTNLPNGAAMSRENLPEGSIGGPGILRVENNSEEKESSKDQSSNDDSKKAIEDINACIASHSKTFSNISHYLNLIPVQANRHDNTSSEYKPSPNTIITKTECTPMENRDSKANRSVSPFSVSAKQNSVTKTAPAGTSKNTKSNGQQQQIQPKQTAVKIQEPHTKNPASNKPVSKEKTSPFTKIPVQSAASNSKVQLSNPVSEPKRGLSKTSSKPKKSVEKDLASASLRVAKGQNTRKMSDLTGGCVNSACKAEELAGNNNFIDEQIYLKEQNLVNEFLFGNQLSKPNQGPSSSPMKSSKLPQPQPPNKIIQEVQNFVSSHYIIQSPGGSVVTNGIKSTQNQNLVSQMQTAHANGQSIISHLQQLQSAPPAQNLSNNSNCSFNNQKLFTTNASETKVLEDTTNMDPAQIQMIQNLAFKQGQDFYERNQIWKSEVEQKLVSKRENKKEREVEGCTFSPKFFTKSIVSKFSPKGTEVENFINSPNLKKKIAKLLGRPNTANMK